MQLLIDDIVESLGRHVVPGRTLLIGIDGGAGAGKTTFAAWFAERLRAVVEPVSTVLTDLIFRPVAERWSGPVDEMPVGYDQDWERLGDHVLRPLQAGEAARVQLYDWVADRPGAWQTIAPGGVVIIDGVLALRREHQSRYDLRIWFECPRDVRIARLLRRGDTSQEEIDYWFPIEDRYATAHQPDEAAHLVVDGALDAGAYRRAGAIEILRSAPCRVLKGIMPCDR